MARAFAGAGNWLRAAVALAASAIIRLARIRGRRLHVLLAEPSRYLSAARQAGGKILKRTKPSGLPLEPLARYEFIVNLKAAKVLGLTVPPTLVARPDRVIK